MKLEHDPLRLPRKETPSILVTLGELRRTSKGAIRVRILTYRRSGPLLDIRQFLTTPGEIGWTPKGVTFSLVELETLESLIPQAKKYMRENS